MNYQQKYLKYKQKYINIKKKLLQVGSGRIDNIPSELYEHIAIRMDVNDIGERIKNLILSDFSDEQIIIFMDDVSISNFDIGLMREIIKFGEIEISDYSMFLLNNIETIYTELLQSRVGDDFNEVITQHSGATDELRTLFDLLYDGIRPPYAVKIINVLPDGRCFYHALYIYIKMARIPYDVDIDFNQLYEALYNGAVDDINTKYGIPGMETIFDTKVYELSDTAVPSTEFLIPAASNYLKLNIMIIQYDPSITELVITVNEIDDPRGYVILFQTGAHYKLIYYTDSTNQSSIYTQIKNLYESMNPTLFVRL